MCTNVVEELATSIFSVEEYVAWEEIVSDNDGLFRASVLVIPSCVIYPVFPYGPAGFCGKCIPVCQTSWCHQGILNSWVKFVLINCIWNWMRDRHSSDCEEYCVLTCDTV
jgi:hypothetical protein